MPSNERLAFCPGLIRCGRPGMSRRIFWKRPCGIAIGYHVSVSGRISRDEGRHTWTTCLVSGLQILHVHIDIRDRELGIACRPRRSRDIFRRDIVHWADLRQGWPSQVHIVGRGNRLPTRQIRCSVRSRHFFIYMPGVKLRT